MIAKLVVFLGLVCTCYVLPVHAQYERIWAFGRGAGLDFSNGAPVPIQTAIDGFGEANASVCDQYGKLLFYTEGDYVWDRNGNLMPNGRNLTPLIPNSNYSNTTSSSLGTVIVPWPGQPSKYFIFSVTSMEITAYFGSLYYSVVDLSLNNGLGDIIPNQKGVFLGNKYSEPITAVRGNRCNIWLIAYNYVMGQFECYEITESGVNITPIISSAPGASVQGVISPSNSGKKIAFSTKASQPPWSGLQLYDFDANSGILSHPILLELNNTCHGVAFSPDDTKLYTAINSPYRKIAQYDLSVNSDMIAGTRILVIDSMAIVPAAYHLKLAENGKVYFLYPSRKLSVINFPNLPGMQCAPEISVVELVANTSAYMGLPNVVPILRQDAFFTSKHIAAPCWANVNPAVLEPAYHDGSWGHFWQNGSTDPTLTTDTPGTYWVSYHTPPCNFHTDTFHVRFPNGVLPTIRIDTACTGSSTGGAFAATYPSDTVRYSYAWISGSDTLSLSDSITSLPAGQYTVWIHTVNCDTSLNILIPEVDYRVGFTLSDTLLCIDHALQFQNTSDVHFNQFQWYFGDGDSSLAGTPPGHAYPYAGSYEIRLTGVGSICKDTARQTIIVDSSFQATFRLGQREACVGDAIHIELVQGDSSITGLFWHWGDGSYLETVYEGGLFEHAYDSADILPVRLQATFRACPETSFTDSVYVYAPPVVDLGGDTSLCLDGHAVVLRNLAATPNENHHYLWNTGDTTKDLRVLQPGSYSLRVTTVHPGCHTTDKIEVPRDCYTDIPNTFTPNGDGTNDYFFPRKPLSKNVSSFKMQVFNRWGQTVFETTNIDGRGWDGRFNHDEQPLGVYIYLVEVVYTHGRQDQYKGNVTLIR